MTVPFAQAAAQFPPVWRERCGMPKPNGFPVRCWLPLSHAEGHRGLCGEQWPGAGSPVPLCYREHYRCWCPHNRPGTP